LRTNYPDTGREKVTNTKESRFNNTVGMGLFLLSKMKKILFVISIAFSIQSYSQVDRPHFGFGIIGGYNSSYSGGGMMLEYLFFNHVDINAGLADRKFQGGGYSVGSKYYPLGIKKFSPVISVNYIMHTGIRFAMITDNLTLSGYRTPHAYYIVPAAGLTYNEHDLNLLLELDYSYALNHVNVFCESGPPDLNLMSSLERRFNGGVGFTAAIIFHPWGN
jgi:hypothetical protein